MESNHVISNVYLDQCFSVSKESAIALYDNEIMTTLITSQPSDDLFYADELVAFSILNN
jgi:hypothetical protein